jgi:hypothetical protein
MQELKEVIKKLNKRRTETLEQMGEVIGLAAQAGAIISRARAKGEDIRQLLESADLTDEQGKRLERVAANQKKLQDGDPTAFRQIMLWTEMSPDPITTSVPSERKPFFFQIIKASQWFLNRSKPEAWTSDMRTEFIRYAEPIAKKYTELTGKFS